jgi:hypothetical protein
MTPAIDIATLIILIKVTFKTAHDMCHTGKTLID